MNLKKNRIRNSSLALSLITVLGLSGCAKTRSGDVASTSIYASFSGKVETNGTLTCEAVMQVGGISGTYLELSDGDALSCTVNGVKYAMANGRNLIGTSQIKENITLGAATALTMTFTRGNGEVFESEITLPPAFSAPSGSGNTTSATVTWGGGSSANTYVLLSYVQTSDNTKSGSFSDSPSNDSGSTTFSGTGLIFPEGYSAPYTATPSVTKSISIAAPVGLKGGSAKGIRVMQGSNFTLSQPSN